MVEAITPSTAGNEAAVISNRGKKGQERCPALLSLLGRGRSCCLSSSSQGGFTFLELVVVLVIMGLAMALIAPDVRKSMETLSHRTAIRELAAVLRHARSQAVHTKETYKVIIDTRKGVYTLSPSKILGHAGDGVEKGAGTDASSAPGISLLRGKLPPGLMVEREDQSFSVSGQEDLLEIRFYAKGNSSGSSLFLKWGESGYHLNVDAITGKVRIKSLEKDRF